MKFTSLDQVDQFIEAELRKVAVQELARIQAIPGITLDELCWMESEIRESISQGLTECKAAARRAWVDFGTSKTIH